MIRSRLIAAGIALVVLAGGAASWVALSGDDTDEVAPPATTTSTAPATTSTTEPEERYPLTGLPVDDPATLERPTLIVKIDNVDGYARPQAGVNQADVVYEEQVEGGVTRFAAVFHSRDAEQVGPVRSARSTDILIGTQFGRPLFAFSGANEIFMGLIRSSPMIDLSYDWHPELYTRVPDRSAPDDIFTPTATLYAANPGDATAPPALWAFLGPDDELPDDAVPTPAVSWDTGGAGVPVTFRWDPELGGWRREQNGTAHLDTQDTVIAPENVLVQLVDYHDTGVRDVAGNPVPEANLVGEGDAWLFADGQRVPAHWSRPGDGDVTTYTTSTGEPLALTPGQTWVALVPASIVQAPTCDELPADAPGC